MKVKWGIKYLIIILIIITSIGSDQISKTIVRDKFAYNEQIQVIRNYLILTKVENTGAFLGLGKSIPRIVYKLLMIVMPLLLIAYALYYILKNNNLSLLLISGISCFIGGGMGNIIDRILYGSVTDFLYFDFVIFHTGIVNIADITVTIGFFLILIESIYNKNSHKKANKQVHLLE